MSDALEILITVSILAALGSLVIGIGSYKDGYHKKGARYILAAPVWPLALLLVAVKGAIYWIPRLWKEAWSE